MATVSVVIPVGDCRDYLGAAIDSVLAQTHPEVELIVVEDRGSPDDTAELIRSFGTALRCLRQPGLGASAARNAGAAAASGEYLAFIDADDLWAPAKLERQLAALAAAPDARLAFVHCEEFVSPDADAATRARIGAPRPAVAAKSASSVLLRRTDFQRVGGFDEDISIGDFLDWYLRARHAGLGEVVLPEAMLLRRLHARNMTREQRGDFASYTRILREQVARRRLQAGES